MDYIIKKRHKQIKKTATTLTNNNKKNDSRNECFDYHLKVR